MQPPAPIGIFDSGFGGLTVFKDIEQLLPHYDYLYLGDNARAPYGDRSFEQVYQFTLQCVAWFFERGCNLVILACNTASAKALRTIQQNDLHRWPGKKVLGIIRPTAEVLGSFTNTGRVGVLGTRGTVASESYLLEAAKFFPELRITQVACPEWVQLVEDGKYQSPEADFTVQKHLSTLLQTDPAIDTVLLACTHYPLLQQKIRQHLPAEVKILSQGPLVAESLQHYLARHPELFCSQNAGRQFFTTGDAEGFNQLGSVFLGRPLAAEHVDLHQNNVAFVSE